MSFKADAERFQKACKGAGCDEKTIIDIVAHHNNAQLIEIGKAFQSLTGSLIDDTIRKELKKPLEYLIRMAFRPHYEETAEQIHDACKGAGTDEKRLIALVLTLGGKDIEIVDAIFQKKYNKKMEEFVRADVNPNAWWAKILLAWLGNRRTPRGTPKEDSDALYAAAKGAGTDEAVFLRMLCTTVPHEYPAIAKIFKADHGKGIDETIAKEFNGNDEFAFRCAHNFMLDPGLGVAYVIHMALKGAGTDEEHLNLMTALFYDRYPQTKVAYLAFGNLEKDIKHDTNGWYEKALMAIWQL